MNLMMLLEMAASGFGNRVAVQNGADRLTYDELFRAAGCAAAEVSASGCERVAMLDVSSLALPVGLFASAWAGVPFVPLNYRLTGEELEGLVSQIAPSYLIAESARVDALSQLPRTRVVSREIKTTLGETRGPHAKSAAKQIAAPVDSRAFELPRMGL